MWFVGAKQSKDYKRVLALWYQVGKNHEKYEINSCYFERVNNTLQCIFQLKNND